MGKLAIGLLGGGGLLITAVVVGNHYLSSALKNYYVLPLTVDDFKEKVKEDKCLQKTFAGLASLTKTDLQDVSGAEDSKLGTDTNSPVRGCLVINWDKWKGLGKEHKDKWRGNFRFLWTFARGNAGFLIYFTADTPETPSESNSKLKVKGMAYVLSKDDAKNTWSLNKGKDIDKELEVTKLPKLGTGLHLGEEVRKWKFAEETSDLSKLCSSENCPGNSPLSDEFFRGYWLWKKESKETADKWSSNLSEWWKEIYSEEDKWKMVDNLKDIEGKWKFQGIFTLPPR